MLTALFINMYTGLTVVPKTEKQTLVQVVDGHSKFMAVRFRDLCVMLMFHEYTLCFREATLNSSLQLSMVFVGCLPYFNALTSAAGQRSCYLA